MRISDWSSDVCSSDLFGEFARAKGSEAFSIEPLGPPILQRAAHFAGLFPPARQPPIIKSTRNPGNRIKRPLIRQPPKQAKLQGKARLPLPAGRRLAGLVIEIGRATCRERVCQYV